MADDANDFDLSNYDVVAKQGKQVVPPDVLGNQKSAQQNFLAVLAQALGLTDAARAFRGEMTPGEAETFALGSVPALLGGPEAKAAEEAAPAAARAIRAFHGSPYDFDKFDLSKIGTGEGAQAYGHGLYFAENPAVAKEYKENLARAEVNGRPYNVNDPTHVAAALLYEEGGNAEAAAQRAKTMYKGREGDNFWDRVASVLKSGKTPSYDKGAGKTYEVSINADPEHFLDWDKPVGKGIAKLLTTDPASVKRVAGLTPNALSSEFGKPEVADKLRQAGIPGIKYLDQGSRGQGKGSYNYVVFDDKTIEILKKYGLAGLLAGGAGGAASQETTKGR